MKTPPGNHLTGAVIGAAIAVHRALGPGLDEAIYESVLSAQLASLGIVHECQKPLPLHYKGVLLDCGFRLDVLVETQLPLELKAVEALLPIHDAQLLTYLRIGGFPLGLLFNFEVAVLKHGVRRLIQSSPWTPKPAALPEARDPFDPLSRQILDAAAEVHRTLGPGLLRSAYEECLCHELKQRRLGFARKHRVPVTFEGKILSSAAEIPLVVEARVPVFCLAVTALTPLHEARLLARLRQSDLPYGLLINFNSDGFSRGIRRISHHRGEPDAKAGIQL